MSSFGKTIEARPLHSLPCLAWLWLCVAVVCSTYRKKVTCVASLHGYSFVQPKVLARKHPGSLFSLEGTCDRENTWSMLQRHLVPQRQTSLASTFDMESWGKDLRSSSEWGSARITLTHVNTLALHEVWGVSRACKTLKRAKRLVHLKQTRPSAAPCQQPPQLWPRAPAGVDGSCVPFCCVHFSVMVMASAHLWLL